jgi:hypothetical protein
MPVKKQGRMIIRPYTIAGRFPNPCPVKPQRLVIPGLTRNPESFSPAQRAAKFD